MPKERAKKGVGYDYAIAGRGFVEHTVKPIEENIYGKPAVSGGSEEKTSVERRAESVYSGYASGVEAAIAQHQADQMKPRISEKGSREEQEKLRDEIAFLKSELGRYVGIMSQAQQNGEAATVEEMKGAIAHTEKKKGELEAKLKLLA